MHYIFSLLGEDISFLFTSLTAIRKTDTMRFSTQRSITEDTDFGQRLSRAGLKIKLEKRLEVEHIKNTLFLNSSSMIFLLRSWAQLFLKYFGLSN